MAKEKGWTVTKLAVAAGFGVIGFAFGLSIAVPLNMITGNPAVAGLVMFFIGALLLALTGLTIRLFPSVTLAALVWGALLLPTPSMGPPGFIFKLLIFIAAGLVGDVLMRLLIKRERLASVIAGTISMVVVAILLAISALLFLPTETAQAIVKFLPLSIVVALIEGPIGSLCGWAIFKKIKNRPAIARLRA